MPTDIKSLTIEKTRLAIVRAGTPTVTGSCNTNPTGCCPPPDVVVCDATDPPLVVSGTMPLAWLAAGVNIVATTHIYGTCGCLRNCVDCHPLPDAKYNKGTGKWEATGVLLCPELSCGATPFTVAVYFVLESPDPDSGGFSDPCLPCGGLCVHWYADINAGCGVSIVGERSIQGAETTAMAAALNGILPPFYSEFFQVRPVKTCCGAGLSPPPGAFPEPDGVSIALAAAPDYISGGP